MLENKFKTDQRKDFEAVGWKFIQLSAGAGIPKGFPDTECIAPNGYHCYVEWKKSKGATKQSLQEYWHQWLNDRGHDAFFVDPSNVDAWRVKMFAKGGGKWKNS